MYSVYINKYIFCTTVHNIYTCYVQLSSYIEVNSMTYNLYMSFKSQLVVYNSKKDSVSVKHGKFQKRKKSWEARRTSVIALKNTEYGR